MNATQWILNLGILALMLSQFGERVATPRRLVLPIAVVTLVAVNMLHGLPTAGNDVAFLAIGAAAGGLFGLAAAATMRVGRNATGAATITAGWAYAALWTAVVGGRIVFALWASGPGGRTVGSFSLANHITPDAWVPFFVLMALCMVAIRTAVVAVRVVR